MSSMNAPPSAPFTFTFPSSSPATSTSAQFGMSASSSPFTASEPNVHLQAISDPLSRDLGPFTGGTPGGSTQDFGRGPHDDNSHSFWSSDHDATLPSTPQPSPPSGITPATAVISPLFIDKVAKDFGLDERRTVQMHAFAQLGSVSPPLSTADLATRLYMLAATFALGMEQIRAASAAAGGVEDLPALFNDLKIRLEDTFVFTTQQKDNIRSVTQNVIYRWEQTSFKTMFSDVQVILEEDQTILRLSNVYGNPFRMKQLTTLVRRVCSSVRNGFRQDICDSISGIKRSSLKDFSYTSALKYKIGGPGDKLDVSFMVHNAILRRFALDHPDLRSAAENEDNEANHEDGSDAMPIASSDGGSAWKKRKTTAKGRAPKGQDFWSRVDQYFLEKTKDMGPKIMAPSWRSFVDKIIREDEVTFPHARDMAGRSSPTPPLSQSNIFALPTSDRSSGLSNDEFGGQIHTTQPTSGHDLMCILNA